MADSVHTSKQSRVSWRPHDVVHIVRVVLKWVQRLVVLQKRYDQTYFMNMKPDDVFRLSHFWKPQFFLISCQAPNVLVTLLFSSEAQRISALWSTVRASWQMFDRLSKNLTHFYVPYKLFYLALPSGKNLSNILLYDQIHSKLMTFLSAVVCVECYLHC